MDHHGERLEAERPMSEMNLLRLAPVATGFEQPNTAMNPTAQQRRFACCWPAGYRERYVAAD
jgi:hypothetical protein